MDSKDKKKCDIDITFDDILSYGLFDGSHESILDLTSAVSYVSPLTWTVIKNDDGDPKQILFFNKNKLDLMLEHVEPTEDVAHLIVDVGDCWATYMTQDDLTLNSGLIHITLEELRKLMTEDAVYSGMAKIIKELKDTPGIKCVGIKLDEDGNPIIPDELKDEIDPIYLKYAMEAYGINPGGTDE